MLLIVMIEPLLTQMSALLEFAAFPQVTCQLVQGLFIAVLKYRLELWNITGEDVVNRRFGPVCDDHSVFAVQSA